MRYLCHAFPEHEFESLISSVRLHKSQKEHISYDMLEKQKPLLNIETMLKKSPECWIKFPPKTSFSFFYRSDFV